MKSVNSGVIHNTNELAKTGDSKDEPDPELQKSSFSNGNKACASGSYDNPIFEGDDPSSQSMFDAQGDPSSRDRHSYSAHDEKRDARSTGDAACCPQTNMTPVITLSPPSPGPPTHESAKPEPNPQRMFSRLYRSTRTISLPNGDVKSRQPSDGGGSKGVSTSKVENASPRRKSVQFAEITHVIPIEKKRRSIVDSLFLYNRSWVCVRGWWLDLFQSNQSIHRTQSNYSFLTSPLFSCKFNKIIKLLKSCQSRCWREN